MKHPLEPFRDDRGQILLLTALSMIVLLGMAALTLDASYMYDKRNRLYAAADAAAKSGAIEKHRNSALSQTDLDAFGYAAVERHGFTPGGSTTVAMHNPPITVGSPFYGNPDYVEAIVSEPTSTFVGTVLGWLSMTPGARAVAGTSSGPNCIITLGPPSASPPSMSIGNSTITMPGCNVANAGNLVTTNPNATIAAAGTAVTGTCAGGGCGNIANMSTGAPPPSDPLSSLAPPADPGGCAPATGVGSTLTLAGNRCYSRIDGSGFSTINIGAGLIYITGAFTVSNNTLVNGTGVLLYFAGTAATGPCVPAATAGCIDVANSAEFHLSAQTSGAYEGILMYQAPTNQLHASFDGNNPIYDLSGAMYFPNADVSFRNGLGATNDCMLFVARSLEINNGNGSFSNVCSAYGGSPILTISLAE